MSITRVWSLHAPVLALLVVGVTACGSGSSSTEATDTGASGGGAPDCAAVWKDGATLDRGYAGCMQDGQLVKPDSLACSSGQRIIRYADHYYAVPGGTIHVTTKSLNSDHQYLAAAYRCRG
jgi:hypothetical protein